VAGVSEALFKFVANVRERQALYVQQAGEDVRAQFPFMKAETLARQMQEAREQFLRHIRFSVIWLSTFDFHSAPESEAGREAAGVALHDALRSWTQEWTQLGCSVDVLPVVFSTGAKSVCPAAPLAPCAQHVDKEASAAAKAAAAYGESVRIALACYLANTMSVNGTGRRGGVNDEPLYHLVKPAQQGAEGNQDVYAECVRKVLAEIQERDHFLFQKMVVPAQVAVHGSGFVCDLLEKPAFFANECELFCADSIRHIPKYLLINGFVVKVRIRDDTLLARAQRAPHTGTTLSPEHAEMLSQYLLRLATALKLAVIAHKDDRITRYTSPLKVVMIVVIMILIVVMMTVAIVVITRYTSPLKALALSNVCSDDSSSSNK